MGKKRFKRLVEERLGKKENKVYADLGDYAGVVETGKPYQVYARNRAGEVIKVYNYSVPNIPGLKVEIGRAGGQNAWQVIGYRNSYQNPSIPNVADHNSQHRYLPVYRDQLVPLMFLPTTDAFVIQIYGAAVIVDNAWAIVENQTLDLTSYVPTAGALYVTLQYDNAGVVSVVVGSTLESKEILQVSDAPPADANHILFGAVRLYDGQAELDRENDFLYPFNVSGVSATGGLPTLDPNRVVVTNAAGDIVVDGYLYYDTITHEMRLGDINGVPFAGGKSFQLIADGLSPAFTGTAFGSSFAPFLSFFKADGTLASPTNVKSGQVLGRVRARGHDGVGWSNTQGEIRFVAAADWSGTSHPINLEFHTTPSGSTTLTKIFTIQHDGVVWFEDSKRWSADNGGAFQRVMERNLVLDTGESLILSTYLDLNGFSVTLNGDAALTIL